METSLNLQKLLECLKDQFNIDCGKSSFQLLLPHSADFMSELKSKGLFPKDFLEFDSSLKWIWPSWKKLQLKGLKEKSLHSSLPK